MKHSLRNKIILIFTAGLFVVMSGFLFALSAEHHEHSKELFIQRANTAAIQLAKKTERLLQLGLHPEEFVGYDALSREAIEQAEGIVYIALLDRNGKEIFHTGNLPANAPLQHPNAAISPDDGHAIHVPLLSPTSNKYAIFAFVDNELIHQETDAFIRTMLLYAGLVSLIAIIAIMQFLRRNLAAPLQSLLAHIQAAEQGSAEKQDLTISARQDELGIVARAFDTTLAHLTQSQAELAQTNHELLNMTEKLEQRVAERTKELEDANAKLSTIAHIDTLTGLLNRLSFEKVLEQRFEHARRNKHTFAILVADLDGFKAINDTYGHAAGDYALKTIGQRIQQTFRGGDNVFRTGGDEFIFVIEEYAGQPALEVIIHKIQKSILTPIIMDNETLPLGVSIGIGCLKAHKVNNAHELLKHADDAMYIAKNKKPNHTFCTHCEMANTCQTDNRL